MPSRDPISIGFHGIEGPLHGLVNHGDNFEQPVSNEYVSTDCGGILAGILQLGEAVVKGGGIARP